MVVQRLRLCISTAGGEGSIPGWGTKIPHGCGQTPAPKVPKQPRLPAQPLSEEHMGPQMTAWFHAPQVCSVVHVPVTCDHPAHLGHLTSSPSFYILKAICAGETG